MKATLTSAALPTRLGFRVYLHQVTDEIQDKGVLRAAWLLPARLAVTEMPASVLSPAWQQEFDQRIVGSIQQLDAGQGIPALDAPARLQRAAI